MTSGKFIAFEGGEGSGKSTQAKLLADALRNAGIGAVLTREPGGTPGAEAIRSLLLDPPGEGWNARAEAILFAAARSDHVEKLIRPTLDKGDWVICDRYLDSSRAYQGGAGGLGDDTIRDLHEIGSQGLRPNLTILVNVQPDLVAERLAERDAGVSDAIGGRTADYHASVAQSFLSLAKTDPVGFAVVDGDGPIPDIHQNITDVIASRLGFRLRC